MGPTRTQAAGNGTANDGADGNGPDVGHPGRAGNAEGRGPSALRLGRFWGFAALGLTLAAGFAVYSLWWPEAPVSTPDTPGYQQLARDLGAGTLSRFHQRTPGYPLILLWTGSTTHLTRSLFWVSLAGQLLVAVLVVILLADLGVPRGPILAVFGWALAPPSIAPSAFATTETTAALCVTAATAALFSWTRTLRWSRLVVFALLAAAASFVRPTFQAMVPAVALALLAGLWGGWTGNLRLGRLLLGMGAAGALTLVALAAYSSWNDRCFGKFAPSSMLTYALSSKVDTVLEFLPDEFAELRSILVSHRDALITTPYSPHLGHDYLYRAWPDLLRLYGGDELRALDAVREASIHLILAKPITYVHESAKLFASFWMPNDYDLPGLRSGPGRVLSALAQGFMSGLFLLQAVVVGGLLLGFLAAQVATGRGVAWPSGREHSLAGAYLVTLSLVVSTMLISCFLGTGLNRYRVPVEPLMWVNLAVGWTLWRSFVRFAGTAECPPRGEWSDCHRRTGLEADRTSTTG